MAQKYFAVAWGEMTSVAIRYAGPCKSVKEAAVEAFGEYRKDMLIRLCPQNPRYMSEKRRKEFVGKLEGDYKAQCIIDKKREEQIRKMQEVTSPMLSAYQAGIKNGRTAYLEEDKEPTELEWENAAPDDYTQLQKTDFIRGCNKGWKEAKEALERKPPVAAVKNDPHLFDNLPLDRLHMSIRGDIAWLRMLYKELLSNDEYCVENVATYIHDKIMGTIGRD